MTYSLSDFGSYAVGGRLHHVDEGTPREVQFTRTVSYRIDPRGTFAVEHAYVQYFVPAPRRPGPPVVLVHGGGMSGSCWETTPDGRPGWLQLLLQRGYEVHVIDNTERGRAGFAPGLWQGDPVLRSLEEAWTLFRIGAAGEFGDRRAFADQKFPVAAFDRLPRYFVPRWFSTTAVQAANLRAVLDRTGPAIVIGHSQGCETVFDALAGGGGLAAGVIALEPSADPDPGGAMRAVPTLMVAGGYLGQEPFWKARLTAWRGAAGAMERARILETDAVIGAGHSHMLMMDHGHDRLLDLCLEGLCGGLGAG